MEYIFLNDLRLTNDHIKNDNNVYYYIWIKIEKIYLYCLNYKIFYK